MDSLDTHVRHLVFPDFFLSGCQCSLCPIDQLRRCYTSMCFEIVLIYIQSSYYLGCALFLFFFVYILFANERETWRGMID